MTALGGQDTGRLFQTLFTGARTAQPALGTAPLECTVVSATTTQVVVNVNNFDATATWTCRYEPRWAWNGSANVQQIPPFGTTCLIAFPKNSDTNTPWVIAFTGWPTS